MDIWDHPGGEHITTLGTHGVLITDGIGGVVGICGTRGTCGLLTAHMVLAMGDMV